MIELLINNFRKYGSLSASEKEAIIESTEIKKFKKGEVLLREGQKSFYSYFILRGCIRQFKIVAGDEKTTWFFSEGEWVISVADDSDQAISTFNWVCMEDCELVVGNEQKAQALFVKYPRLEAVARRIVESALADMQKSLLAHYAETPEQRYLALANKSSNILNRVPQYHIASFIGIKPESLSRIRKRMAR